MAGVTRDGGGRLAEKLRSEYRNRGVALNGVEATPTSELMKRAQMGRDPKVNVSAEAFDDRMQGRAFRDGRGGTNTAQGTAARYGSRGASARNQNSSAQAMNGGTGRDGVYGSEMGGVNGNGTAKRRAGVGQSYRAETDDRFGTGTKGTPRGGASAGRRTRNERTASPEDPVRVRFAAEEEDVFEEIRVERKRIPAGFLLVLVFFTVMVMLILTSVAQIYQTTREISDLEERVVTLKETIDDLELKLDEKNDIRLIEQMATAELGMVKEDSLQKKYISLSDGEHVDLIGEKTEEDDAGGGSTMLSGFFEMFGGVFEYFR